ncbi:unnamed protein product [Ectocarpus sp. CCAP 1310/34]|nr:unnamed protein product [Ectocarpus sp. CCAP 1310/34]
MCDVWVESWKRLMSREMTKLMASKVVCEAWPSRTRATWPCKPRASSCSRKSRR